MAKVRVHELAKELGLSSKETIEKLAQIGVEVKSHSSSVEEEVADKLRGKGKAASPKPTDKPTEAKPAPPKAPPPPPSPTPEPTTEAKPTPAPVKEPAQDGRAQAAPAPAPAAAPAPPAPPAAPAPAATIQVARGVTVEEFAEKLGLSASEVIKKLLSLGEMRTITQSLTDEEVELLSHEFNTTVQIISPAEEAATPAEVEEMEDPALLEPRAPVVTVMGHVDHGKSSILQHFRQKEMLALEAGGITQAIGAYQVHGDGERVVTFIDTPGHEAFTQMRARGAQITDLAVLVVAADDGVQPQTVEALDHARAANVPVLVAVNKIDRPDSDPTRVRQQLSELGLQPEEWGGDTVYVDVSARNGDNMDQLLEMIHLVADLQELKANPGGSARGVAIEAHLDKGRGPVATLIVQKGALKVGEAVVCGTAWCRVRAMADEMGQQLKVALPSQAVQVTGWSKVPEPGDDFRTVADDREAKRIVQERETRLRQAELVAGSKPLTLQDLLSRTRTGEVPVLNLIVKADSQGSLEALIDSVLRFDQSLVRTEILRKGVGAITENDVTLAEASGAIVVGFNVRPDASARQLAEKEGVDLRTYEVIYQLLEDIEQAARGLMRPVEKEFVLGSANILQTFRRPGFVAAGCQVTEGKVTRDARVRLVRDGVIIYTGQVFSLRRFRDDVREVPAGQECALTLEDYNDVKEGDVIEFFEIREVAPV